MESWSVLGSGSDDDKEEEAKTTLLDFGGIKISSSRVLELMQSVQHKNTVELDSIGETYQRRKLKKKKKKKKKGGVRMGVGGAKSMEDVSETTSEIRSTTCTSTSAAECRDMRRPKFDPLFDDPELDDNGALSGFKALTSRIKKAPPPPSHKQEKQIVAQLAKITADEQKRRQRRWQKAQQELTKVGTSQISPLSSEQSPNIFHQEPHQASSNLLGGLQVGSSEMDTAEAAKGMMEVSMEEEEDDRDSSESDSDMKFSLLSQINKIEKLLDFEVS